MGSLGPAITGKPTKGQTPDKGNYISPYYDQIEARMLGDIDHYMKQRGIEPAWISGVDPAGGPQGGAFVQNGMNNGDKYGIQNMGVGGNTALNGSENQGVLPDQTKPGMQQETITAPAAKALMHPQLLSDIRFGDKFVGDPDINDAPGLQTTDQTQMGGADNAQAQFGASLAAKQNGMAQPPAGLSYAQLMQFIKGGGIA